MAKGDRKTKKETTATGPSATAAMPRDGLSRVHGGDVVYGDPVTYADRVVIPAAKVSSAGGFGLTPRADRACSPAEEDAGAGRDVHAWPVGYIEMTRDGSRWVPAFDVTAFVVSVCVTIVLVACVWTFRRGGRRRGR
jgi:hypothetical protein